MLGFTLAELAVVLLVIGLLMFALLPTSAVMLSNSRHSATQQKLNNIDAALVNFVIVNKRLPCPADGSLVLDTTSPVPSGSDGTEGARDGNGDCTNSQAKGIVPWVALGLTINDVVDAWNNLFTYRAAYGLTRNTALDMSSCDPAGTANTTPAMNGNAAAINTGLCNSATCIGTFAAANCTTPSQYLAFKGINVESSVSPVVKVMDFTLSTGAAYVLISHGDNGYGAYSAQGVYQTPTSDWTGAVGNTLEDPNWNTGHTVTSAAPPTFVDATFSDSGTLTAHFDDVVLRPLLMSVITRAQLGPRSH